MGVAVLTVAALTLLLGAVPAGGTVPGAAACGAGGTSRRCGIRLRNADGEGRLAKCRSSPVLRPAPHPPRAGKELAMDGNLDHPERPDTCRALRADFQAYVDGDLARERSLEVFLHARECRECAAELAAVKHLFAQLKALPPLSAPADFDARVLAAVPYAAYRAMEPLRRERVPVFLEETFLPAPLRAPLVRAGGLALAAVAGAGLLSGSLPDLAIVGLLGGLLPESLVRLQRLVRRRHGHAQRSESG